MGFVFSGRKMSERRYCKTEATAPERCQGPCFFLRPFLLSQGHKMPVLHQASDGDGSQRHRAVQLGPSIASTITFPETCLVAIYLPVAVKSHEACVAVNTT